MVDAARVERVFQRVRAAAARVGRDPGAITVAAATKRRSADEVNEFLSICRSLGVARPCIAESYMQEMEGKVPQLEGDYSLHFIGPLQSNKSARVARQVNLVESVGSHKIIKKISALGQDIERPLPILLQINISGDEAKQGFSPNETKKLLVEGDASPGLEVRGLMTITKLYEEPEGVREDFRALRLLGEELSSSRDKSSLLSMGMSRDYEIAIEEGASIVRIGTEIFGPRD